MTKLSAPFQLSSVFLMIVGLLSNCSPRQAQSYSLIQQSSLHIAILPCQVARTGLAVVDPSPHLQTLQARTDAQNFQMSLYNSILDELEAQNLQLHIQPVSDTNTLLASSGYQIEELWLLSSKEQAELLGVDAVLQTNVYLSETSGPRRFPSLFQILGLVSSDNDTEVSRRMLRASASLADGTSGVPIWNLGKPKSAKMGKTDRQLAQRFAASFVKALR